MTEAAMIEAVRAVGGVNGIEAGTVQQVQAMDPAAVDAFKVAMGEDGGAVRPTGRVPFADQVIGAWRQAERAEQVHLRRVTELATPSPSGRVGSAQDLLAMQYELATMGFNMEVTMSIAKKTSDAVTTMVKNG